MNYQKEVLAEVLEYTMELTSDPAYSGDIQGVLDKLKARFGKADCKPMVKPTKEDLAALQSVVDEENDYLNQL